MSAFAASILATPPPTLGVGAGWIGEVDGHAHVFPWLRVGGYGAYVHATSSTDYTDVGAFSAVRFGASTELHARPKGVVDPWLGVGVGVFVTTEAGAGIDFSADAGVDFHIGRHVAIGLVWMLVLPVTNEAAFYGQRRVDGLYYTGALIVPLPALRLQLTLWLSAASGRRGGRARRGARGSSASRARVGRAPRA